MNKLTIIVLSIFVIATLTFVGCSKDDGQNTNPTNPCASKTIVVTGTTTATTTTTASNGSISASATGSSGFTFSLNGGTFQTSGTFSGLAVGTYTVTAKDGDACTGSQSFSVTATTCPTIAVTATITQAASSTSATGAINATATGSTGFTYSKDGTLFQASGAFTGLLIGNYTITAKDANGCIGSNVFSVTTAPCPTITLTTTVTNASGPSATNGSIVAVATGGATPYTFSKDGGTTFQATATFNNLATGSYAIVSKDVNGCLSASINTTVGSTCPTITVTTTSTNAAGPTATNGSIVAVANGGAAPYTFSRNGGTTFQATGTFGNLTAGSYAIVSKDANGCLSASVNTTVGSTCPTITANSATTNTIKCEPNTGSITITATGGALPYAYSRDAGATFQSSNIFNLLGVGNYSLSVKDANGCTIPSNATINQAPAGTLFSAVKSVLAVNCAISGCHALPSPQNGLNFADDCTIVGQAIRIKARAVDANPSVMPPTGTISAADRQKIVDWVNAGGKHNN